MGGTRLYNIWFDDDRDFYGFDKSIVCIIIIS